MGSFEASLSAPGVEEMELGPNETSIDLRGLRLRRGDRWIFKNLDLSVKEGELIVLRGCSGSGKTSLLSILFGQRLPFEGEVKKHKCSLKGEVAMMYQDLRLVDELSVLDNVLTGRLHQTPWWRSFFGFSRAQKNSAIQIIKELELDSFLNRPVKFLSGGERQRVAVCRLLFQNAKVILADEPVSSLDPRLAEKVLLGLKREAKEKSKIVICALHQRDIPSDFADRIIDVC
jgi:phosphonate transport system ATP-binding protein